MAKTKKLRITWWVLRESPDPMLHAVRDERDVAMCGWKLNDQSRQVTGPKTIDKHRHCVRCTAQIERFEMMR